MSQAIQVVYPKPDQLIYESCTFLLGSVPRGYQAVINGTAVKTSAHGFFCHPVSVHPGENRFTVLAANQAPFVVTVRGVAPLQWLPGAPLVVDAATILPRQDLTLKPGDWLTVACVANPDAEVTFSIPGLIETPVYMFARGAGWVDNREGVFAQLHQTQAKIAGECYYQGRVQIPQKRVEVDELPIWLHVQRGNDSLELEAPGRLSLLEAPLPVEVLQTAVCRSAPEAGARLTPQSAGTQLWVDGVMSGWARIRLSDTQTVYLPQNQLRLVAPHPPMALEMIHTAPVNDARSQVEFTLRGQCPVLVDAQQNCLKIRFYQAISRCDFIYFHPEEALIQDICWTALEDEVTEVLISLQKPLAGYTLEGFTDGWRLHLKRLPTQPAILIDPGHGGEETGAIGPDGTPEKELNLRISQLLKTKLGEWGFTVSMTREMDVAVSLETRAELARAADIVLSIHHNALPDGRQPLDYQGFSAYYYQPFAKKLAQALLNGVCGHETANAGLYYDSLSMTRIAEATAVLLELGFMTHPEEYEQLIDANYQQQLAERIAQATQAYLANL